MELLPSELSLCLERRFPILKAVFEFEFPEERHVEISFSVRHQVLRDMQHHSRLEGFNPGGVQRVMDFNRADHRVGQAPKR